MPDIKTPVGDAPVIPVILIMAGFYLAWFGIHYWRTDVKYPSTPVKDVLQGKGVTPASNVPPSIHAVLAADVQGLQPDSGSAGGSSPAASSATGSAIADAALKYKGQGYVWGGPADHPGNWDCSSFVSYVLGHDLGLALPGGKYGDPGFPPHAHGPTTLTYLLFGTAINSSQVAAGDLIVYNTHIGIAISSTDMISAEDPQQGTGVSSISGMTSSLGEIPHFRRVSGG